jgi:peptidoglycan/xylan/chitin deacetylase (PgdA/CDA1 family)
VTLLHHPQFSSWVRGHLLCRVEGVPDRFALTFDDGPSANGTPAILDVLRRHGARATFFMLGENASRHAGLARRIVAEGHEVAVHGGVHWPAPLMTSGWLVREVRHGLARVAAATGERPEFYRPPFGLMVPSQAARIRRLGLEPVLGDVYPEDPHRPGVARIARRVLDRLTGGSIVILHDGSPIGEPDRSQTVAALDPILAAAERRGLRSVTVRELVGPVAGAAAPV